MSFGVLSLLPPLLAIGLSFRTRNVLLSLFVAVFVGATMLAGYNPAEGFVSTLRDYLFAKLGDPDNASIALMMLLVGVFSTLLERGGAATALLTAVSDRVKNPREGQVMTWIGGLLIWFSDSSNAVILGPIVRPVTDRVRISREKLAYLLDATAATVPSVLPITAWGAFILGILAETLPDGASPMQSFISAVPFHLYTIAALLLVLLFAVTGWDFGPMRRAEQRARTTGVVLSTREADDAAPVAAPELPEAARPTVWGMIVPVAVMVIALFTTLWYTGAQEEHEGVLDAILQGSTMVGLVSGFFWASVVATVFAVRARAVRPSEISTVWMDGFRSMVEVVLILVLAWSIGAVTTDVGAPEFIVQLTQGDVSPALVFVLIFLAACAIAFATGSSWGTFAIILPIAIPVAIATGVGLAPAIGAAIAGGVFGDHCSPISDTTILASFGAGCDHLEHVRTQMPYAVVAATAALVGYVVAGYTDSGALSLAVTLVLMVLFVFVISRIDKRRHPDQVEHTQEIPVVT